MTTSICSFHGMMVIVYKSHAGPAARNPGDIRAICRCLTMNLSATPQEQIKTNFGKSRWFYSLYSIAGRIVAGFSRGQATFCSAINDNAGSSKSDNPKGCLCIRSRPFVQLLSGAPPHDYTRWLVTLRSVLAHLIYLIFVCKGHLCCKTFFTE